MSKIFTATVVPLAISNGDCRHLGDHNIVGRIKKRPLLEKPCKRGVLEIYRQMLRTGKTVYVDQHSPETLSADNSRRRLAA